MNYDNYIDSEYRELEEEILEIMKERFPMVNFIDEIYKSYSLKI